MSNRKKIFIFAFVFIIISFVYTILVKTVDVSDIGPNGSFVGFSTINQKFFELTGMNSFWYKLTKYLGYIPFLIVLYYGVIGFIQLITRKSILKVDKRIIYLGILYVLLGITYLFFEKVIINYRPVLLEGELEASYPSSHTMLALVICASSILISKYYVKNKSIQKAYNIITSLLMIILIIGRALSGVHWITDIIGGIIISITMVSLFYGFAYTPIVSIKSQKEE